MNTQSDSKSSWILRHQFLFAVFFICSMLAMCVAGLVSAENTAGVTCYSVLSFGLLIILLVVCHAAEEITDESS